MAEDVEIQETAPPDRDLDDIVVELDCAGREATFGFFGLSPTEGDGWSWNHKRGQGATQSLRVVTAAAARPIGLVTTAPKTTSGRTHAGHHPVD